MRGGRGVMGSALQSTPTGLRAALANGAYLAVTKGYYLLLRGMYIAVFVHLIGVELYGYYTYAQNWYVLFMPLAMWGMNELLISEHVRTDPTRRAALIGSGLALRLLLGTLCCLGIIASAALFEDQPGLRLLVIVYSQGVLARSLTGWFSALFVAHNRSLYWLYISVFFTTVEVVAALSLASAGAALLSIALCQCAVWWCKLAVAWRVYHNRFHRIGLRWNTRFLRFYLRSGAALGCATFLLVCMTPGLLVFYRHLADDLRLIGEVAIVLQLFQIIDQMIMLVSNAALPEINRASSAAPASLARFLRIGWNGAFLCGGAVSVLCMLLVPQLIALLPPNKFDQPMLLFARFSWIIIPLCSLHSFRLALISTGRIRRFLGVMISGPAALLALILTLHALDKLTTHSLFAALGASFTLISLLLLGALKPLAQTLRWRDLLAAPVLGGAAIVLVAWAA